jgi:hypothetical protein
MILYHTIFKVHGEDQDVATRLSLSEFFTKGRGNVVRWARAVRMTAPMNPQP